eukprot:6589239-Pyramimonas_sp.AAC.1
MAHRFHFAGVYCENDPRFAGTRFTTDQSDAGRVGIFARRTNWTAAARRAKATAVGTRYSHHGAQDACRQTGPHKG